MADQALRIAFARAIALRASIKRAIQTVAARRSSGREIRVARRHAPGHRTRARWGTLQFRHPAPGRLAICLMHARLLRVFAAKIGEAAAQRFQAA